MYKVRRQNKRRDVSNACFGVVSLMTKRTRTSTVPLLCHVATQQFVSSGGFIIGLPTVTGFAELSVDVIGE
jgi:hypothetical protein